MKKILRVILVLVMVLGFSVSAWAAEEVNFSKNVYKLGMKHKDVEIIQQALKQDGVFTYSKTTTYFGQITKEAVKKFQQKYGLKVDGIVGKATLTVMREKGLFGSVSKPVSRGASRKMGKYLDWSSQVKKIVSRGDVLDIEDVATGKNFEVKVTAGTHHADVEALTMTDTEMMKSIWGGFSWTRRPVLVYTQNQIIAASMTNMPHAGVESKPAGQTVSGRSGGYGTGYNFDTIKGNGMSGHVDLHFRNSLRHKDNNQDSQHQQAVKQAAGIK